MFFHMIYKSGQIFLPGIWDITAQCDAWFSALYKYSYLLTYLLTVLSQSTRVKDRRTDGQTEFSSLDRVCIPCSAVKTRSSATTKSTARPSCLVGVLRARGDRCPVATHHSDGQCVACPRSTACFSETCYRHAICEEIWSRFLRHE